MKRIGGLSWRHWRWEAIPVGLQYKRNARTEKKWCLKGYWRSTYPLETLSPTIALQERPACVLHSVQHALTVYIVVQSQMQCSMLCMLLCAPHHWHNANANQHLVCLYSQYIIVGAVLGGGKAFPQLLQSCNIMPHCACSILCSLVWDVWISTHYAINPFGPTVGHIFKTKTKKCHITLQAYTCMLLYFLHGVTYLCTQTKIYTDIGSS